MSVGALIEFYFKLIICITIPEEPIASSCPYQDILAIAYSRIQAIAGTG
ncbi:hypothetical protein [Microcystis aeruginosa]|nr:hypothetical protein [Microcystis aeruginosa]